ncbi:MAG: peptidoglycan DD-metalloendopeptidase family protein [Treponema sp.]
MNKLYISLIIFLSIILFSFTLFIFTSGFTNEEVATVTQVALETVENTIEEKENFEERALHERIKNEELPNLYYIAYQVQEGEMVGGIAARFDVSQDAIISLNKIKNTRTLQIGQLLKIPSIDGILYTVKEKDTISGIAKTYRIDESDILSVNQLKNDILPKGFVLFLPNAKLDWMTIQEINGDMFVCPIHGRYRISSRYGWRSDPFTRNRSFHNGLDMATHRGTPVFAALAGVVVSTGYSPVYGNHVIIRHHSGYKTLYGHLNSIFTSPNRYVTTVTQIGTVGSTGRSTGPHLHFTVYKNGATINPSSVLN